MTLSRRRLRAPVDDEWGHFGPDGLRRHFAELGEISPERIPGTLRGPPARLANKARCEALPLLFAGNTPL